MKSIKSLRHGMAAAATTVAALAIIVCAAPQRAEASPTSAGATVYNKVTVTYASGSVSGLVTSSSVKVTVTTLAAAPTVSIDTQTASILSGATKQYTYTIKSNSNGTDTYTVSKDATSSDSANIDTLSPSLDSLVETPIPLWGGFAVGSGAGYITVPGGSLALNPIADGSTVTLTVGGTANQTYSVFSTAPGNAQGDGGPESPDTITLTPISGPAITPGSVTTGTQVGEYKTFTNTVTGGKVVIDPATPLTISDGTHITVIKVVTTATDLSGVVTYLTKGTDSNLATTTILAPKLSIVKKSRNATTGGSFALSGTTARPGEVVEYEITIKNEHTTGGATISNANVVDILPSYSTYVGSSTKIDYNSAGSSDVSDVSGASPLAGSGYNLGSPLAAGDTAVITYQATVN